MRLRTQVRSVKKELRVTLIKREAHSGRQCTCMMHMNEDCNRGNVFLLLLGNVQETLLGHIHTRNDPICVSRLQ